MFDIRAAVKAAKLGGVVTIPPGSYPAVTLSDVAGVTLSGPGAVLAGLTLSACTDVTVENLAVRLAPTATTVASSSALRVVGSTGVTLRGLTLRCGLAVKGLPQDAAPTDPRPGDAILGLPIGRALTLDRCEDVALEGCDLGESHKGAVLNNSRRIRLLGNDIHDTRTGQISGAGVSDVLIEGNRLSNARPWKFGGQGDHGDFIHLWTAPRYQTGPSTGVVIRGNLIEQADGQAILGIYLDDNGNGLGFRNARIEGNLILNGNAQALRLERTQGVVLGNRSIQTSGDANDAPSIRLWDGCAVLMAGNVMYDVLGAMKTSGAVPTNIVLFPDVDLEAAAVARAEWLAAYRSQGAA